MTTNVRIRLLSQSYELKQSVLDAINSKYIMSYDIKGCILSMTLDMDNVSRNMIIESIPEELLEWIDEIEVSKYRKSEDEPVMDCPFVSADKLIQ